MPRKEMITVFEVGIRNTETGEYVKKRYVPESNVQFNDPSSEVMGQAQLTSQWFDSQDTCYSGRPIWEQWEELGVVIPRIHALVNGTALRDYVSETVVVFDGMHGVEHEFYIERV